MHKSALDFECMGFDCDKHTKLISEKKIYINDECMSDSRENSYRPSLIFFLFECHKYVHKTRSS